MDTPALFSTPSRNIVLVYNRGPSVTHYVGLEGCTLAALKQPNTEFDTAFEVWCRNTPEDFATKYLLTSRSVMIGLTGAAHRVLKSIIAHSSIDLEEEFSNPILKDHKMATVETARKPDGPVAQIIAFLDKNREAIMAGTISRKELIEKLEEKGYNHATIVTQCGHWGRTNSVTFVRPAQAEAVKAEAKAAKKKANRKIVAK